MYKNYLVIASKKDSAGINITTQLSQFQQDALINNFRFYLVEDEIIYTENLDMEKINNYDFIIFASKHKSEKKMRTLSVHAPGNFRTNDFGGEKGKLCPTSAIFQKQIFERLNKNVQEFHLKDYNTTLECTHHGPLINKPCIFIEIGSTEKEWKDTKAGFVVAKTIFEIMSEFQENPYNEIAIGIGGPHYAPNFTNIQLKSNVAVSHIIPQYVFPLTEEMVKEAVEKTEEEVDFALLDWKGLGTSEHRQDIIKILDKLYVRYKRTSDVDK
ncbi:MAG TPA: D-aminoacyl-tRNA deacylase [Patescibacteria group bacterium]|nr:D-aminoacyl-tRNA deacylase [Patescibacteria group bacterium]